MTYRCALITGASSGIGEAFARALPRSTSLLLTGRDRAKLAHLASDLANSERTVRSIAADLATAEGRQSVIAFAEGQKVDLLVNNAGVTRDTLIARMSDEDWELVIDTNLRGSFNTCRAVVRNMLRRRSGAIVNVTSIVGLRGNPGQANYVSSKAGLVGLTKALARELGTRGVRVNAVAPGYIDTELTQVLPEKAREAILANTPLARLGEPGDVARAVRFLCSDEASFVTGEVLLVDGGLGM